MLTTDGWSFIKPTWSHVVNLAKLSLMHGRYLPDKEGMQFKRWKNSIRTFSWVIFSIQENGFRSACHICWWSSFQSTPANFTTSFLNAFQFISCHTIPPGSESLPGKNGILGSLWLQTKTDGNAYCEVSYWPSPANPLYFRSNYKRNVSWWSFQNVSLCEWWLEIYPCAMFWGFFLFFLLKRNDHWFIRTECIWFSFRCDEWTEKNVNYLYKWFLSPRDYFYSFPFTERSHGSLSALIIPSLNGGGYYILKDSISHILGSEYLEVFLLNKAKCFILLQE